MIHIASKIQNNLACKKQYVNCKKTPRCGFNLAPLRQLSILYFVRHQFSHQTIDQKFKTTGKCAKLHVLKPKREEKKQHNWMANQMVKIFENPFYNN